MSAGGKEAATTLAEAHARLRADSSIQWTLPDAPPPPAPKPPPAWLEWLFNHLGLVGGAGNAALYAVIGFAATAVLWLAARWWLERRRRSVSEEEAEWRPDAGVARALLDEAEALAAKGRYAEAARLLLHCSLEDVERRRPGLVRPALTARELARADALPPAARAALAPIVRIVEHGLFAGRDVTGALWEEARDSYRRFALPGVFAREGVLA